MKAILDYIKAKTYSFTNKKPATCLHQNPRLTVINSIGTCETLCVHCTQCGERISEEFTEC